MPHYHIGHNTSGYSPNNAPYCFDGEYVEAIEIARDDAHDYVDAMSENGEDAELYDVYNQSGDDEAEYRVVHPDSLDELFWAIPTEKMPDCDKENI